MTVWLASPPAPRSGLIDRIFSAWQGNLPPTPPSEGALTELATRLTLLEAGQAKADAERAALIETNARLEERLAATAERFAQERKTTTRQSEIIIQLQSTITSLQETSAGHTAEFLSFSDTIGALKEQNRDQHNRMLVMRKTIDNLQNKIAAGEMRSTLPPNATEEQVKAWRSENGIPEAPEKYELKLKDGLVIGEEDKPIIDAFLKSAHGANMTAQQASQAVDWYYEEVERQTAQRAELQRRVERYRAGRERVSLRGRVVLIVDDGFATGATARAACRPSRPRIAIACICWYRAAASSAFA